MEEILGSENVDENGLVSNMCKNENPNDKILGPAARDYGKEFHDKEESVGFCGWEISNAKFDSQNRSEKFEIGADATKETYFEDARVVGPNEAEMDVNKCISLFVDVFGPPHEFTKGDEQVLMENLEGEKSSNRDEMEMPSPHFPEKEKEVDLSNEDKFVAGDVVWVRTTTNSWWPGHIVDQSYVSNVTDKSDNKSSHLVKYIGKYPTVWSSPFYCSPKQLKPFVENFEQMSSLRKYRIFPSVVKEAVDEFGRRVKAQLTCFCKSRAIKETNILLDKNVGAQFELVNFLNSVKNLACNESEMGVLEIVKIRSHLSAFYGSLGHHQLPVNQLCDKTDDDNDSAKRGENSKLKDAIGSGKGFKRGRKSSKYLPFPYIKDETNNVAISNNKITPKNSHKRKGPKTIYQPRPLITPRDIATPSVDLLSKLRLAALGCVMPSEKSDFDLVDRFFYGFRRWTFDKHANGKKSNNEFKPLTSDSSNVITPKQKRRKDEEISSSSNSKPAFTSSLFNVKGASGSFVINFENPGTLGLENISEPKRKKRSAKKFLERMEGEIEVVLPDVNGNCTMQSPVVVDSQAKNNTIPINDKVASSNGYFGAQTNPGIAKATVNTTETCSFTKKIQVNSAGLTNKGRVYSELMNDHLNDTAKKTKESSLLKDTDTWLKGFLGPANNIPIVKKRKRKEKAQNMEGNSTSIPDLNGNVNIAKTDSQAEVLPGSNSARNEAEPPKKRKRRNKIVSPRANFNPGFSKVLINEESLGTALVLTFAAGFPVPSKEVLITIFRGFGSLNETETKGSSDNLSAQVVFRKVSDAVEALKGIEKSCPFGPVLVKCRLHHLSPVPRPIELKPCELKATISPIKEAPIGLRPCELKTNNIPKKEAPDLDYIRKNLEMMTSALEKEGNKLPPEMRERLENGVKALLKKVSTMVGSKSSS